MKRIATALLTLAAWGAGPLVADPLHKIGNDGTWVHVDSGWLFARSVAGFERVGQPYSIDGNDDAGAEYRLAAAMAEVEIYSADSAAPGATLEGAKAVAASKAGDTAQAQSEVPYRVEALKAANGVKVRYAAKKRREGPEIHLYYFATDRWRVKILINTDNRGAPTDEALDAFVRALPWTSLGTDSGLH
jgi:hypothetical protein